MVALRGRLPCIGIDLIPPSGLAPKLKTPTLV
jgi:hypothetical protein